MYKVLSKHYNNNEQLVGKYTEVIEHLCKYINKINAQCDKLRVLINNDSDYTLIATWNDSNNVVIIDIKEVK